MPAASADLLPLTFAVFLSKCHPSNGFCRCRRGDLHRRLHASSSNFRRVVTLSLHCSQQHSRCWPA